MELPVERAHEAVQLSVDWLWAGGCASWALAAVVGGHAASPVGATVVALNLVVAVLFMRRRAAREVSGAGGSALAAACVLMGAVALGQAPAAERFPWHAQGLFVLGGLGAMASLWTLGRSFGVLPARRGLIVSGPYRLLRHPAYACELVMVAACCLPGEGWLRGWPLLLTLVLVVLRIRLEERLLGASSSYRSYTRRVRYRLVYGVW